MNVINRAMSSFFRVAMNGSGAARSALSRGLPALVIAAMTGNAFGANLTWVGDGTSNPWDIGTSLMWNDGSAAAVYTDGDTVTLDDTGSDSPAINLTATVSPASVTVSNTTRSYTIAGAGSLAGTMTLTKSGTNTLTLCTTNTFSGVVTVSGGILDFAPPGNVTMANQFTGSGVGFRKSGANKLTISGGSKRHIDYWCGSVAVDGGILQFGTSSSVTYSGFYRASAYTVNSGATIEMVGQSTLRYDVPWTVNGGTVRSTGYNQVGPLTLNGGILEAVNGYNGTYRAIALNGHVTVIGSVPSVIRQTGSSNLGIHLGVNTGLPVKTFSVADVTGDTNADLTVSAILFNSQTWTTAFGLTKAGAGTMVMSAANGYTGATTVHAGTLLVSGSLASPTVNVNNGGTLLVSGSSPLPSALVTVASNGTFGAAGTVATSVTNLTFAEGAKVSWTYDGGARTAGLVNVTGTLTLPAQAAVILSGSGTLRSDQVLFTAETVAGATDLSGWTFENKPGNNLVRAVLIGKQVVLRVSRGTTVSVW